MVQFEEMFSKIPPGSNSVYWSIPTKSVDEAIKFFKSKKPDVRYLATESWSEDDFTNIKFNW
jgi:hypothetical protein